MSSDIKISVVVPVYNVENYLPECLDSLINQTLSDIEIICVNDGSTDNSLSILEDYAQNDNRIKIIIQENMGLSGARNTGLDYVNGKYVFFLDSDDWIELNALDDLFNYAEKLDLEITIFQLNHFNQSNKTFFNNEFTDVSVINNNRFDNISFNYMDVLDVLFDISHNSCNKLYKVEFLNQLNARFNVGKKYEDVDFHYKTIFKANNVGFLRKHLYNYRIRNNSICTSGDEGSFDIFDVLKVAEDNTKQVGIYEEVKQNFFKFLIINIKFVFIRLNIKYRNDFFKILQEKYIEFNLDQVDESINAWHFDDRVFYQAISPSDNGKEFELTYKKLYYEFLSNHYEGVINQLREECNRLNNELNKQNNFKNKIKRLIK